MYDLIVIGGGPAGLIAAKVAAEKNLEVVLIEAKNDVAKITRTCSQMLHLSRGLYNENVIFENGKIIFEKNGFAINYKGAAYELYHKYAFSPCGFKLHMMRKTPPMGIAIDKGALLKGLFKEGEKAGLNIETGCFALKAENTSYGVKVYVKKRGKITELKGQMLIAADGLNSRIVEGLGLNNKRTLMGTSKMVEYVMEGVDNPFQNSIFKFVGKVYSPAKMVYLNSTPYGHETCFVLTRPEAIEYFIKKGKISTWFKNAKIIEKRTAIINSRSPIIEPLVGNILIVGDAAGTTEVLIQGALMLGYKAGLVAAEALKLRRNEEKQRKLNEYVNFWRSSIDYVRNPEMILTIRKGVNLFPFLDELGELDYIFSLTNDDVFEGELNPVKLLEQDLRAILKYKEKIKAEKPELFKKIIEYIKDTNVSINNLCS